MTVTGPQFIFALVDVIFEEFKLVFLHINHVTQLFWEKHKTFHLMAAFGERQVNGPTMLAPEEKL